MSLQTTTPRASTGDDPTVMEYPNPGAGSVHDTKKWKRLVAAIDDADADGLRELANSRRIDEWPGYERFAVREHIIRHQETPTDVAVFLAMDREQHDPPDREDLSLMLACQRRDAPTDLLVAAASKHPDDPHGLVLVVENQLEGRAEPRSQLAKRLLEGGQFAGLPGEALDVLDTALGQEPDEYRPVILWGFGLGPDPRIEAEAQVEANQEVTEFERQVEGRVRSNFVVLSDEAARDDADVELEV